MTIVRVPEEVKESQSIKTIPGLHVSVAVSRLLILVRAVLHIGEMRDGEGEIVVARARHEVALVLSLLGRFAASKEGDADGDESDEKRDADGHKDHAKAKLTLTECIVALTIAIALVTFIAIALVHDIPYIVVQHGLSNHLTWL